MASKDGLADIRSRQGVEVFCRIGERVYIGVLLLSSMQVTASLTSPPASHTGPRVLSADMNVTSVAIEAGLYLVGALLVLKRWRHVLSAARRAWPLVGVTALAPLSILWSVNPALTLRRSVVLLASTMLAIYLGERYTMENFARLVAQTLCVTMLVVVILSLVAPWLVIDYSLYGGAWKGLSGHKNPFGEYMATTVILLLVVRFRHFRWLRYVFLVAAAALLVLSDSATALACCVLVIAAIPLWRLTRNNNGQRLVICATTVFAFCVGLYFVWTDGDLLFRLLSRDSTLTGRTQLWASVLPAIMEHPILGYGYGAFWSGLNGEVLNVWSGSGWAAPLADNGYIDLCLSLGLLGVCSFAYLSVRFLIAGMEYARSEPGPIGLWPITYLCFFLLHNVSESALLTAGTFSFLVFATIATSLAVNRPRAVIATWPPFASNRGMRTALCGSKGLDRYEQSAF